VVGADRAHVRGPRSGGGVFEHIAVFARQSPRNFSNHGALRFFLIRDGIGEISVLIRQQSFAVRLDESVHHLNGIHNRVRDILFGEYDVVSRRIAQFPLRERPQRCQRASIHAVRYGICHDRFYIVFHPQFFRQHIPGGHVQICCPSLRFSWYSK